MPAPEGPRRETVDPQPVVYGYLRAEEMDEFAIPVWRREIRRFCGQENYRLETIFVDRLPGHQVRRPGFGGLLGVLALRDTHGVVLLNADHLSAETDALLVLQTSILATDSKMIIIHEECS